LATVNIGNLTFTHRGDYDGSTAYAKNDVVYYSTNGNAYIAKQATTGNVPTNGTYWSQFAQGSGGIWNAGLSLGSAGQAVKVNAAGNALEFGTISTGAYNIAQYNQQALTQATSTSNNYSIRMGTNEIAVTPSASTDLIELNLFMSVEGSTSNTSYCGFGIQYSTSSGSYQTTTSAGNFLVHTGEHSISMGSGSVDNRYRYVGFTIKKTAADFSLSAGTTYYLSAHGTTHSNNGAQFKFAYNPTAATGHNSFSLIRYTV
jgi:hypothetical protein